jgi:hypothetical protein
MLLGLREQLHQEEEFQCLVLLDLSGIVDPPARTEFGKA